MHISYFAGLLDGEGAIYLRPQGRHRCRAPQLSISMADPEPIHALQAAFGGYLRTDRRSEKTTMSTWRLDGSKALELLRRALPHLVIERRRELARLLVADPVVNNMKAKSTGGSKVAHNERLFQAMRARNQIRLTEPVQAEQVSPSADDCHYLAGILDGEGHISFKTRRIEVWSTDPELCSWLAARFGGKVYRGADAKGNQRKTWRWLRSATGCQWAQQVAGNMLLERKARELRQMQGFSRTAPSPSWPISATYLDLRALGVLRAPAAREAGISVAHAKHLDRLSGTLPRRS